MAIYSEDSGYNRGNVAGFPAKGHEKVSMLEVTLDWAAIAAARVAAGQTAVGAGDGVAALRIPAKTLVLHVGLDVTTAEGGTLTVDVGDGDDPDGFLDGVNANTLASYASTLLLTEGAPNITTGYSEGKYYSAADTIDLITVNAADAAVMRLWALVVDCS